MHHTFVRFVGGRGMLGAFSASLPAIAPGRIAPADGLRPGVLRPRA